MKYLPDSIYENIFDIDFAKLYANGKRIILSDLDNTLARYDEHFPSDELIAWSKKVASLGFKLYLISNNTKRRINKFAEPLKAISALAKAHKPFGLKLKRFLIAEKINNEEVIFIGDQLVTDVILAKKCKLFVILVKTIDPLSQKWYTKINRRREKKMIKKIKKRHNDIYQKMVQIGLNDE